MVAPLIDPNTLTRRFHIDPDSIIQTGGDGNPIDGWTDIGDSGSDFDLVKVPVGSTRTWVEADYVLLDTDINSPCTKWNGDTNGDTLMQTTDDGSIGGWSGSAYCFWAVLKSTQLNENVFADDAGSGLIFSHRFRSGINDMYEIKLTAGCYKKDLLNDWFVVGIREAPVTGGVAFLDGLCVQINFQGQYSSISNLYRGLASDKLRIGGVGDGGQFNQFAGNIAEIVIVEGVQTYATFYGVQNWLLNKYGFNTPDDGIICFEGNSTTEGQGAAAFDPKTQNYPSYVQEKLTDGTSTNTYKLQPHIVARSGDGAANEDAREATIDGLADPLSVSHLGYASTDKNILCYFPYHNENIGSGSGAAFYADSKQYWLDRQASASLWKVVHLSSSSRTGTSGYNAIKDALNILLSSTGISDGLDAYADLVTNAGLADSSEINKMASASTDDTTGLVGVIPGVTDYFHDSVHPRGGTDTRAGAKGYELIAQSAIQAIDTLVFSSIPTAPTLLTATTISSSQINLAWTDNSSDETGFQIERKIGGNATFALLTTNGASDNIYSDKGLTKNTRYYYQVRAVNADGNSVYTNTANTLTSDLRILPTLKIDNTVSFISGIPDYNIVTPFGSNLVFLNQDTNLNKSLVCVFDSNYTEDDDHSITIGGFPLSVARSGSNYSLMAIINSETGTDDTIIFLGNHLHANLVDDGRIIYITENSEITTPTFTYVFGGMPLGLTANRSLILTEKIGTIAETATAQFGDTQIVVKRIGSKWYFVVVLTNP